MSKPVSDVEPMDSEEPAPSPRPPMNGLIACLALATYGALAVYSYGEYQTCTAAIPRPEYYLGSYIGTALFALIGAFAVRAAVFSHSAGRVAWGLAALESFAIAAFIYSTIFPTGHCKVWPW